MASKNPPTAIVSGAYWAASFFERLSPGLCSAGWDNKRIHALVTQSAEDEMERGVTAFIKAVAGKVCKLREFFVTRPGLYVWDEFTKVLSVTKDEAIPAALGKHYDLPETMIEAGIREKLGQGHVFEDVSAFCATLAQTIEAQWGGAAGPLQTNGYANIFFVRVGSEVLVVLVLWDVGERLWDVYARRLGAVTRWYRGGRAFSATVELGSQGA